MKIEENMKEFLGMIREEQDKKLKNKIVDQLFQILIENGVKITGNFDRYIENIGYDIGSVNFVSRHTAEIEGLDFSEHDKPFNNKISELEEIINTKLGRWDKHGISYKQLLDMQKRIGEIDKGMIKQLPRSPINIAKMLIDKPDKYSVSDLRQIAQHLLIYCDNAPEDEE